MTRDVRVVARAKLTLSLRVLGRRPDGFHELEALVVSLRDPHDVVGLRIQPPFGVRVRLSGRAVIGVPFDDSNLASRAARLLLEVAAEGEDAGAWAASGLDISLHKSIPAGAGLGGGSADAAGTLVGGARLLGLRLDTAALAALGASLGSDVPFCVAGGAAWMRGRGEILEPLTLPVGAAPPAAPGLAQLRASRSLFDWSPGEEAPPGPPPPGPPSSGRSPVPAPPGASRLPAAAPPPGLSSATPWPGEWPAGGRGAPRRPGWRWWWRSRRSRWRRRPSTGRGTSSVDRPPLGPSPSPMVSQGSAFPTISSTTSSRPPSTSSRASGRSGRRWSRWPARRRSWPEAARRTWCRCRPGAGRGRGDPGGRQLRATAFATGLAARGVEAQRGLDSP